ncbi:MAG: NADH-quinone oxidoreductase subunit NuoK [Myxococcales bacterium]|nr:MAG: NADH-quinone oxidoreductase subunit NuoK [Myxococcales bacterium]
MIPIEHILIISGALFGLGLMGLTLQRSILRLLLAIEAMFNGAAFGFIGVAIHNANVEGHIMFLLILSVAAAEVCIALALVLNYDRIFKTLDISISNEDKA